MDVLGYKKTSSAFLINGIAMAVVFFLIRIVTIPPYWLKVPSGALYRNERQTAEESADEATLCLSVMRVHQNTVTSLQNSCELAETRSMMHLKVHHWWCGRESEW